MPPSPRAPDRHNGRIETLSCRRLGLLLAAARTRRILVVGDVMLDQFIWGQVSRISPEAPVPVVEFDRESYMPGGAANVARNLTALGVRTALVTVIGRDPAGRQLRTLLEGEGVDCGGVLESPARPTSIKTRIVAQHQQVVRLDRESRQPLGATETRRLISAVRAELDQTDGLIIGDYGKGVVTQDLLDELRLLCRPRGIWLSLDPKPTNPARLSDLSLITPNRREAFALAHAVEGPRTGHPKNDPQLLHVAERLLQELQPALLLITLGEQGMLLCQRRCSPFHIPTAAREVFDVSGAGDTVIASFTLAIVAGASPVEAAVFSNHAAGVVVGKLGTASVSPQELLASFQTTNPASS